jgi:ABC-type lipoprotein release transport system permease subunit
VSVLVAALVAWPLGRLVANELVRGVARTRVDSVFEPQALLLWLLVCVALAGAASLLPAWHASRASVREAISYE